MDAQSCVPTAKALRSPLPSLLNGFAVVLAGNSLFFPLIFMFSCHGLEHTRLADRPIVKHAGYKPARQGGFVICHRSASGLVRRKRIRVDDKHLTIETRLQRWLID